MRKQLIIIEITMIHKQIINLSQLSQLQNFSCFSYYRFSVQNKKLSISAPFLTKPFHNTLLQTAIPLKFDFQPTQYIVLRNYILPTRPKQYKSLHIFLAENNVDSYAFTNKQWQYKLKDLDKYEKNRYKKMMEQKNMEIYEQQKKYDNIVRKCLKKLPFYYNMLLAKTQYLQIFEGAIEQDSQEEKQLTDQEYQQYLSNFAQEIPKLYTSQQIFHKLYTLHPYIKSQVYKQYAKIHDNYEKKYGNPIAFRLPILYIKHPYEFYMIDQVQNNGCQLSKSQFYLPPEVIQQYEEKWLQLSKNVKQQYQSRTQKIIVEYEIKIHQALEKTRISSRRLIRLVEDQFSKQNQKILQYI